MQIRVIFLVISGVFCLVVARPLSAADPTADNRMREALRNTMLQLRSCETEKATLQAAKAEADEVNKRLSAKVDSLAATSSRAEKTVAEQAAEIEKFKVAIEKWQVSYQQATDLAGKKNQNGRSWRRMSSRCSDRLRILQTRNASLFKIGNEILTRYEHFGLGDALKAKEPFVGITRVKLENFVQDYRDKLADQKIKP